jgi:hypothetical protein
LKKRKRIRSGFILTLTCLLILLYLSRVQVIWAAEAIDTDAKCSLTVSVENSMFLDHADKMTIPVSVYRVAEVDVSGHFTAVVPFAGMSFADVSSSTTAEDWSRLAKEAERCLNDIKETGSIEAAGSVKIVMTEGSQTAEGTIGDLATGLYLVTAEPVYNKDYTAEYTFSSYLTALPGNAYAAPDGENLGDAEVTDDWNYNPVIGLKAEWQQQTGRLIVTKRLENYNETLGPVSFGFHIIGRDDNDNIIYDNFIKIDMDNAESKSETVINLPAGMKMTVTEEYQGGSYKLVQKIPEGDLIIVPDHVVDAGEKEVAEVTFTNRYDGGNRGGYGVTNHFYDSDGNGGWQVEKKEMQAQN